MDQGCLSRRYLTTCSFGRFGVAAPVLPAPGPAGGLSVGIGIRIAFRKNHALAGLAGVDAENGAHRHLHRESHAAETRLEADEIIAQFSIWVAEKLTLSTILPSLTYWRGTVTPSAAASTTMCGVSPLSEIHSCSARRR